MGPSIEFHRVSSSGPPGELDPCSGVGLAVKWRWDGLAGMARQRLKPAQTPKDATATVKLANVRGAMSYGLHGQGFLRGKCCVV